MTQTKTKEAVILEMIKILPIQQQEEVINFIKFLQFKAQKQDSKPLEEKKRCQLMKLLKSLRVV